MRRSEIIAKFYELSEGEEISDITERLLQSPDISQKHKDALISLGKRVYIFTYPSDGLKIKAFISFVPDGSPRPLILQMRGGNKLFGLMNPANELSLFNDYPVICTSLRGGVSEGEDEFGGADVNDIQNLVDYLPVLEKKIQHPLQNQKLYIVAYSRGGMEMFLALARFPVLQKRVSKIVALSGLLDLRMTLSDRRDMNDMFVREFGLNNHNYEEWISHRDPLMTADKIRFDLPILIVQGTNDIRVPLEAGYHMVQALQEKNCTVTYWELEGNHCLRNRSDTISLIFNWLEN
ncbi:MAG: alpha/beta fold hydrolase [Parachlamydiaceae bacterium]|nr:MAG: alpha/beta fold hydrolase [Parachlamydiaceae bacterium]